MNSSIFSFAFQDRSIRTAQKDDGSVWLCLGDCLDAIESKTDINQAKKSVESGLGADTLIKLPLPDALGQEQNTLFVSESGATFLLSRSRTEAGKALNRFIHCEVLPSIRKTGSYSIAPQPPKLPSRELAVETAVAIDRIQDILSKSNPRLAQILIDCAMNDVLESSRSIMPVEFPGDKWYGLVQIASKMGIKMNPSTRVKLGQYIGNLIKSGQLDVERVREDRLCNGQYESIWCYRDNDVVRAAIRDWSIENGVV